MLNDELNDYLRNGTGDRSECQVAILECYKSLCGSDLPMAHLFTVTEYVEQAYKCVLRFEQGEGS